MGGGVLHQQECRMCLVIFIVAALSLFLNHTHSLNLDDRGPLVHTHQIQPGFRVEYAHI